jgi:TonB family protein
MRVIVFCVCLAGLLLSSASITLGNPPRENSQAPLALITHSLETSDIRSPDSGGFRLRVRVQVWGDSEQAIEGSYLLLWAGASHWREETTFPGYHQVRVGGNGRVWLSGDVKYTPLRIWQWQKMWNFQTILRDALDDMVERAPKLIRHGNSVECLKFTQKGTPQDELCFDRKTDNLIRYESMGLVIEYSSSAAFGKRQFPRVIQTSEGGKLVVVAHVEELVSETNFDPNRFQPAGDAVERQWCIHPSRPLLIKNSFPLYPEKAKKEGRMGKVSVYALVDPTGSLQNLKVVRSAGPDFDASALEAVKNWRYAASKCNNVPVPVETVIDVAYTLEAR